MYDFIIVGGGSAGCVLAKRLTENSGCNVLLLEAGPTDWNPFIHMPAGVGELLKRRWTNWFFDTDSEPNLDNRRLYWPRGKVLGGSSSMNGMIYMRGHKNDYDRWAGLPGCEGWDYDTVLPWFKKSEGFVGKADQYHGTEGELGVTVGSLDLELFDAFENACRQADLPETDDFNGTQQEGFARFQTTIRDGVRQSVSRTFLSKEVRQRPNLDIATKTRVSRLLKEGDRITGVEIMRGRRKKAVKCRREVLLCAGSVQSPQVLQLSGIGPADYLTDMGIQVEHALPGVGENLQDHLDVCVQYNCSQPVSLYDQTRFDRALLNMIKYQLTHKGLATSNAVEWGAFLRTPLAGEEPDIQLHFIPAFMIDHNRDRGPGHGFMMHACQLRPHSRGRVRLWSTDPHADPRIEPNYLSDERDLPVLIEAVKICRNIMGQKAFDPYRGEEYMPGAAAQSDDELAAAIRRTSETIYHPVGTCKMGDKSDDMAVVDRYCRVHGLDGLRVIDASVFPQLMGGNTNAPTIMVAERMAADLAGEDQSA